MALLEIDTFAQDEDDEASFSSTSATIEANDVPSQPLSGQYRVFGDFGSIRSRGFMDGMQVFRSVDNCGAGQAEPCPLTNNVAFSPSP